MKTYNVELPITGFVSVQVQANNEEEAIKNALKEGFVFDDIQQWDVHEKIVEGRVFHGILNEADAVEVEDIDENDDEEDE